MTGTPSNGGGEEALLAVALPLIFVPEGFSTAAGIIIVGAGAIIYGPDIINSVWDAADRMKGGKQGQRDRDYGLPPELIDWWHNGGGKAGHGGQDIGSEYGPTPGEILQEWEDLGRPSGSKPRGGRRYPR